MGLFRQPARLSIRILDVGPIRDADLSLAPLTVLVGPSGSGKSYAAALVDSLSSAPRLAAQVVTDTIPMSVPAKRLAAATERLARAVDVDVARAVIFGTADQHANQEFSNWLSQVYLAAGAFCTEVAGELALSCWHNSLVAQVRAGGQSAKVICSHQPNRPIEDAKAGINYTTSVFAPTDGDRFLHGAELARLAANYTNVPADAQASFDPRAHLCVAAMLAAFRNAADEFGEQTWLLPAGRAGLWHARRLAATAIGQGSADGMAVRPVLQFFLGLAKIDAAKPGVLASVADEIDERIHQGQIRAHYSPGSLPDVRFFQPGLVIPIDRASSSIAELAPLTLWVRHLVVPGALLIIEEPEAHLHPTKQLALAEALARLVRAGVRLVITTHSDLLLRKLGAVVMKTALSYRDDPEREIGDWDLRPDDLAVYRFSEHSEGGFVTTRETVDNKYGIDTEELSQVEEELYEERGALRDRLGNLDVGSDQ